MEWFRYDRELRHEGVIEILLQACFIQCLQEAC